MIFNVQAVALKMSSYAKVVRQGQFHVQNASKKPLAKCYPLPAFNCVGLAGMLLILNIKKV